MKIKYTRELLEMMGVFARIAGVQAKDCFQQDGTLFFVVEPHQIGRAIGRQGINAKELQHKLQKRVRILEFSPDVCEFVRNVLHPVSVDSVEWRGTTLVLKSADSHTKGVIIGRNAKNLNRVGSVVQRYFDIIDIKVE